MDENGRWGMKWIKMYLLICICLIIFVYLYLCIYICVFVFVNLYLCICICELLNVWVHIRAGATPGGVATETKDRPDVN